MSAPVEGSVNKIQEGIQDTQNGADSSVSSSALEYTTGHTEFYLRSCLSYTGSNSDSNLSYLKFDCQCHKCHNAPYLQESVSRNGIDLQTSAVSSDSESTRTTDRISVHSV